MLQGTFWASRRVDICELDGHPTPLYDTTGNGRADLCRLAGKQRALGSPYMSARSLRRRRLETTTLHGTFFVSQEVLIATAHSLQTFRDAEGDHEGIVFWGGRESDVGTLIFTAVIPVAEHSSGRVFVTEERVLHTIHSLREMNLGLLAQIHSHPGQDARHSCGDDQMVLAPYEGMLSIVVPHYARYGLHPLSSCGVHQFQDGTWKLCNRGFERMHVIPASMDMR